MEFSFGLGAVVGSILWLGPDPISRLMELSPGRGLFYRQYIGIVALSMPAAGLFMVTSMSLQGAQVRLCGQLLAATCSTLLMAWCQLIGRTPTGVGLVSPDCLGKLQRALLRAILMIIIALRGRPIFNCRAELAMNIKACFDASSRLACLRLPKGSRCGR